MAAAHHGSQSGVSRHVISWERLIDVLLAAIGSNEERPREPAREDDLVDLPPPWYLT